MRKDKCLFCNSRRGDYRIVTNDMTYDEVACRRHNEELNKHSDQTIPGKMRWFISGTGHYKRGDALPKEVE